MAKKSTRNVRVVRKVEKEKILESPAYGHSGETNEGGRAIYNTNSQKRKVFIQKEEREENSRTG